MKKPLLTVLLGLCLGLATSVSLHAQWFSSPNVPIDDPVYRDIDKLVAAGLIKDAIYGQRPWSRGEMARLIHQARQRQEDMALVTPDERDVALAIMGDEILKRLEQDYHEELVDQGDIAGDARLVRLHPLEKVAFDFTLLDSPFRIVPANNGLAALDAVINPLVAYREGRHYVDGHTLGLESTHTARLSPFFSIYARPRLEALIPNTGSSDFNLIAQQLYGKFSYKNFEMEVGRDSLSWGQGEFGGILSSNNTRPFDMIKISNDAPFFLPWFLKYLGPVRSTLFIANLGPEREFPYAFLTGVKVSIKPVSFFEIGIDHILVLGGDGAPELSVGEVISEFFFVRSGDVDVSNFANHQLGVDFRLFFPFMRNSQLYLDMQVEDMEGRTPGFMFTGLMNYQAGFYIPRLISDGSMGLRFEYHHGSPMFGRHGIWITGMSLNRRLMGSELGPHGEGLYLKWNDDWNERLRLTSMIRFEIRDSDILSQAETSESTNRHYVMISPGLSEWRLGLEFGGSYAIQDNISIGLNFGYERVGKYDFTRGDNRNNFLGALSISWRTGL